MSLFITAATFVFVGFTFWINASTVRLRGKSGRGLRIAAACTWAMSPVCIVLGVLIVTGVIK